MKRFLLAVVLALTIHGLFLGLGPKLSSKTLPAKPKALTITFALNPKPEAGPGPELEYPVPSPNEVVRAPEKKEEKSVVRPKPQKEIPKPPEKGVSPNKKVPKSRPKADVRPKRKILKPPPKKLNLEKKKRIITPPPVKAQLGLEKKPAPGVMPNPVAASVPTPVPPIEEREGDLRDPLPGIPGLTADIAPEAGEKTASVSGAKKMIRARPAYRENPRPEYPKMAKRRGHEGTVLLEVLVDSTGKVDDLRVLESSGYRVLDRSAMKSVKNWLFEPGSIGDQKVNMWVRVPVRFELK